MNGFVLQRDKQHDSLKSMYCQDFCLLRTRAVRYVIWFVLTFIQLFATLVSLIMTTLSDDLLSALRGVGLSKNEALIYVTVLELGASTVWDIAKKSGIKRPTCYLILDELVWKGHAAKTNDGRRTLYSVVSPKQLLNTAERKLERFSSAISQFDAIGSKNPQKPIISLFEGVDGIVHAYNLSLDQKSGETILIYGTQLVEVTYRDLMVEYISKRVKKGIHAQVILADTDYNRTVLTRDKSELRQTRFLPKAKFDTRIEINIFGDTITYIAHSETAPFATVIENATLAQEEKQRFNLLWEVATP